MRRRIAVIVAALLGSVAAKAAPALQQPVVDLRFESNTTGLRLVNAARTIAMDSVGRVLRVPEGAHAEFDPPPSISAQRGTIVFWLRPLWSVQDERSHVLLSAPWADGKGGYMAVSYGWWEPLGKQRLYFIVNNQQAMHCSTPYRFDANVWVMVSVTWNAGPHGECAIYIDANRVANYAAAYDGNYGSAGPWYIGSDRGAADQRQRVAGFVIDDLRVFDHALPEREIRRLFGAADASRFTAARDELGWMRETLALLVRRKRAADGTLLESRVLFDEDMHWAYSKRDADRILQRIKAAGFNVYVPCVWHGRGTYYPTRVTSADARLVPVLQSGYDPLAYLIERAHALQIEVHPWFTVARREWDRYPEFYPSGTPEGAYDVHRVAFRDFIVRLILDVVDRYPVDGINLDYIRAMGICVSQACAAEYEQRTGRQLASDYVLRFVTGEARRRLEAWQDAAVADIVERVAVGARRVKPQLVISVDGHPKPPAEHRPLEGRDELAWANRGWIDVVFAMDYRRRIDDITADASRAGLEDPRKQVLLFGNFDRVNDRAVPRAGQWVDRHVEFSRRRWPDSGLAFYIYQMLSDEQVQTLRAGAFQEPARPFWPVGLPDVASAANRRAER